MLGHTNFILLLLSVFLILPFPALTKPDFKVTCRQRPLPVDKELQQDCHNLIQKHVVGRSSPAGGSTAWEEERSASSHTESLWSVSSGSCIVGFSAPRPLSQETWNTIREGIKAGVNECVGQNAPAGTRSQVPWHISRRAMTEEQKAAIAEMRKGGMKMTAGSFAMGIWARHRHGNPRLGAVFLVGTAMLFGQSVGEITGGLNTLFRTYHESASPAHRASAGPPQRGPMNTGRRSPANTGQRELGNPGGRRTGDPRRQGPKYDELRRRGLQSGREVNDSSSQIESETQPSKVTCHSRSLPTDRAFKKGCRGLIQKHVIKSFSPSASSSGWKEETFPGSQTSTWSISSKLCTISFSLPRPLSEETWNTVKEDIEAIADACVDKKGVGGSRGDFGDPWRQSPPKYPLVWIEQSSGKVSRKRLCREVRFRSPSSLTPQEKKIQTACWKMYGGVASAAAGGLMIPKNSAMAAGLFLTGATLGLQGAAGFHYATHQLDVPRQSPLHFPVRRGLGEYISRRLATRRLCQSLRFRHGSTLTEREKRTRSACWQIYGGSAWAATGVGMMPLDPRLATSFIFAGASLGIHGMANLASASRPPPKAAQEPAKPLERRSHGLFTSPIHTPRKRLPLSPVAEPKHLLRRGLCSDLLVLNPLFLTVDQKKMRKACIKMLASTAAITVGGAVTQGTKHPKAGVGLVLSGTALGIQGAYQYSTAKVSEFFRKRIPFPFGDRRRRRSLGSAGEKGEVRWAGEKSGEAW